MPKVDCAECFVVHLLAAPQSQQMVLTGILSSSARMRSLLSKGSFLSDMALGRVCVEMEGEVKKDSDTEQRRVEVGVGVSVRVCVCGVSVCML